MGYVKGREMMCCFEDKSTAPMKPPIKPPTDRRAGEYVVLLHGLARGSASMKPMARHLTGHGYGVVNMGYPSTKKDIHTLAATVLPEALAACRQNGARTIHFVTHSMGGILVRCYLGRNIIAEPGRIVMLSPPNHGSEVVDRLKANPLFCWFNGPAGQQLGTDSSGITHKLGPVNRQIGVITGDRSVNLLLSRLIAGPNDGKVSVKSARLPGMADFRVIHATHPFIMRNRLAIGHTLAFLETGRFLPDAVR
ncbi:MAG: alpha/beta fold hydrolase [Thermodesulfobacteriota bacterium]|nr:alpha/beta fold hydrolase [Thermodesulfobacteriota bacterium]